MLGETSTLDFLAEVEKSLRKKKTLLVIMWKFSTCASEFSDVDDRNNLLMVNDIERWRNNAVKCIFRP
jgi:hypothetical protein